MSADPRVLVLEEMRKQTALLTLIQANLTAMAGTLLDMADRQARQTTAAPAAVSDRICDGPRGDPLVNQKDPRDWTGDSMKGKHFSECPPDYLDLLAERLDHFAAQKDASDPAQARKQKFEILDAQRARGWAARKRNGWQAPPKDAPMREAEPTW